MIGPIAGMTRMRHRPTRRWSLPIWTNSRSSCLQENSWVASTFRTVSRIGSFLLRVGVFWVYVVQWRVGLACIYPFPVDRGRRQVGMIVT